MSNGYNDYKNEMESYVKFFAKDGKFFCGVMYDNYSIDAITYQFCDFMCDDAQEFGELLRIREGDEYEDYENGGYIQNYVRTHYLRKGDYLMCDNRNLFVVDADHIKEYTPITEKEYVRK